MQFTGIRIRHPLTAAVAIAVFFGLGPAILYPSPAMAAARSDSYRGTLENLLIGFGALLLVALLVATVELVVGRVSHRADREAKPKPPGLSALHAQRVYDRVLYNLAPAAVAGALVGLRSDDPWHGALVFAAMAATASLLRAQARPLHLMPIARYALLAFAPLAGIGVALVPNLFGGVGLERMPLITGLLGAWLITAFGIWLGRRFESERPVRLALIGDPELAHKLAAEMAETRIHGYRLVGFLGPGPQPRGGLGGVEWLGEVGDVRDVVRHGAIDLLVVGPGSPRLTIFEEVAEACLDLPVRMIEATALYESVLGHVPIGSINSAWFQSIMHPRYTPSSPLSKRVLDLVIAIPAALVSLPLVALAAVAIKLGDGGPVFYRQRRVGEQGREFDIVKLRTMRVDAGQLVGQVPKEDLITGVGRLLRRTHVDELPQLFNVLKGEMTIVGPRPEQPLLVEELARLVPYYERRSLLKPGVTGWAQVRCGYAGSQVGTAWKMCHDLYYIKHRSTAFDLLIMVQTLHTLFSSASDVELPTPAEDFILGEAAGLLSR